MRGPGDTDDFLARLDTAGNGYRRAGAGWKMRVVAGADHGMGLCPLRKGAKGCRDGLDGLVHRDVADNRNINGAIGKNRRQQGFQFFHIGGLHLRTRWRDPALVAVMQDRGRLELHDRSRIGIDLRSRAT